MKAVYTKAQSKYNNLINKTSQLVYFFTYGEALISSIFHYSNYVILEGLSFRKTLNASHFFGNLTTTKCNTLISRNVLKDRIARAYIIFNKFTQDILQACFTPCFQYPELNFFTLAWNSHRFVLMVPMSSQYCYNIRVYYSTSTRENVCIHFETLYFVIPFKHCIMYTTKG